MTKRMSAEMFRRVRLGNIRALLLDRCRGRVLPDDDAGREYLAELLVAMSLGRDPKPGMILAVTDYAPWAWEKCKIEKFIDDILALPTAKRRASAKVLGERLRVTNEERERLHLWTIRPVGMTDQELIEQKKAKRRERQRRRRQASGAVSRAEYLAASKSRKEPWKAAGMSRASWYRRNAETSPKPSKESIPGTDLSQVAPEPDRDALRGRRRDRAERAPRASFSPASSSLKKFAIAARLRGPALARNPKHWPRTCLIKLRARTCDTNPKL